MGASRGRGWWVAISVLGVHAVIAAQTTVTHRLEVNRVGDVVILAEREADEILAKMGHILQADDDGAGPNDVPCEVEFTRDGAVGALTTTTGSISTEDEFGQLIKLPGDVKIVDFIEWCYSSRINTTYWGCTDGTTFAVVNGLPSVLAAVVWAHEFGHIRGLSHRVGDPSMIMNTPAAAENRRVDGRECRRYRDEP